MHLLFLLACAADDKTDSTPAANTDDSEPTVEEGTDADGDGYFSVATGGEDCDDEDGSVFPDAAESCDGADQDCDGLSDEDFDGDGDGFSTCDGSDCDDDDGTAYPGAVETAGDGVDQDCDGFDLTDGDGDGFDALAAGGNDCDDADGTINPGAVEVPNDGIDQDCNGSDGVDNDADDDGFDSIDLGGIDCDDADPEAYPGHVDYLGDGVDSDCDDYDGAIGSLGDAAIVIDGATRTSDYLGFDVALCDLDEDGRQDIVVAAPFGASYLGEVGIYYGSEASTWGVGTTIGDAGTRLTGTGMFLGFGVECADLDGDGHQDLLVGRGEIHYEIYESTAETLLFYGDGSGFPINLSESDADAVVTDPLGTSPGFNSVTWVAFHAADVDGDGASEIMLSRPTGANQTGGDDSLWVLASGFHRGEIPAEDLLQYRLASPGVTAVAVGPDVDGDGTDDLLLAEGVYDTDTADTGYPSGRLSWVEPGADVEVTDAAVLSFWSQQEIYFGYSVALGDFDANGTEDVLAGAPGESLVEPFGGGLYYFDDLTGLGLGEDPIAAAAGHVNGASATGLLGLNLQTVGDVDGDGADDVLTAERYGGTAAEGVVWLLSGARFSTAYATEDAAILGWNAEEAESSVENALAGGDIDGDGRPDLVIGAFTYGLSDAGRVYVFLSDNGGL